MGAGGDEGARVVEKKEMQWRQQAEQGAEIKSSAFDLAFVCFAYCCPVQHAAGASPLTHLQSAGAHLQVGQSQHSFFASPH